MSISKLKYQDLTEIKNNIFKEFAAPEKLKNALFTILTNIQAKHPKLRLKDIKFSTNESDYFYITIIYKNRNIQKMIRKNEINNTELILLESLKNI